LAEIKQGKSTYERLSGFLQLCGRDIAVFILQFREDISQTKIKINGNQFHFYVISTSLEIIYTHRKSLSELETVSAYGKYIVRATTFVYANLLRKC